MSLAAAGGWQPEQSKTCYFADDIKQLDYVVHCGATIHGKPGR